MQDRHNGKKDVLVDNFKQSVCFIVPKYYSFINVKLINWIKPFYEYNLNI